MGVEEPVMLRSSDLDTLNRPVAAEAPATARSVLAALHSQQAEMTTSAPIAAPSPAPHHARFHGLRVGGMPPPKKAQLGGLSLALLCWACRPRGIG